MSLYAVIDTNVLVSALITKNDSAATLQVMKAVLSGKIIPLYHQDILMEYAEVLARPKFHLAYETIRKVIRSIITNGVEVFPKPTGEILIDMDDLIFYEVAMEKREDDAFLVTGNQKHYPIRDFIVTPSEMLNILSASEKMDF
ncbi:MAG: putative toxin-antitoxin system toxin component, PIN family [Ruminococcus sp.]